MLVSSIAIYLDFTDSFSLRISLFPDIMMALFLKDLFACTRIKYQLIFRHMLSMQPTDPALCKQISILQYVAKERGWGEKEER